MPDLTWRRLAPSALRRVPRGGPDLAPAVLIVTSRQRLWQRHGADGVFAIERAVGDLVAAMDERGLVGTLIYTDDSPALGKLGVLPADTGSCASVARTVRTLADRLRLFDDDARYLLILGGDAVVPFDRAPNPSPDGEAHVLSDHLYARQPDQPLLTSRAVGRLPDPSLELLLGSIRGAAAAHRRLAAGRAPLLAPTAFGFTASVWKRAARAVFAPLGDPRQMRQSPPVTYRDLPASGATAPRFHYFNLHGLPDSAHWFGQRDPSLPADYPYFPVALRPEDITAPPGAVVVSEACFGGDVAGRATGDSVALSWLARGALAFVGATGVAYGGLDSPLVAADLLAHGFWRGVCAGMPAGMALAAAKTALVHESARRQGYVDAEDEKAILSFVLYGDPSLVHQVPSVWAHNAGADASVTDTVEGAGPAASVGTVSVQPHSLAAESRAVAGAAADGLIEAVRRAVSRRLPEFATAEACVTASVAGPDMIPKTADLAGTTPDRTFVVTLSQPMHVCEGSCGREYARVTIDGHGRIRKLAVSR